MRSNKGVPISPLSYAVVYIETGEQGVIGLDIPTLSFVGHEQIRLFLLISMVLERGVSGILLFNEAKDNATVSWECGCRALVDLRMVERMKI